MMLALHLFAEMRVDALIYGDPLLGRGMRQ